MPASSGTRCRLGEGKTAWALYAAGRASLPTLRELGHEGIAISHYTFDRACFSALQRSFKQTHLALVVSDHGPSCGYNLLDLTWVLAKGCALHDCHNGLTWSLYGHFHNTELMKDVFIATQSLRNSFTMLPTGMGEWMATHIDFVGDDELPDPED